MQTRTPPPAGDIPPPPYTRVIRRVYPYSLRPLVIGLSIFGLIWGAAVGVSNIQDVGDEGGESVAYTVIRLLGHADPYSNDSHEENQCVLGRPSDHVFHRCRSGTVRHGRSDSGKSFLLRFSRHSTDAILQPRLIAKAQGGSTICCSCPSRCAHCSSGRDP